ncbi:MAG: hypothetical protein NVS3B20_23640 [Polyangiales bacterium]
MAFNVGASTFSSGAFSPNLAFGGGLFIEGQSTSPTVFAPTFRVTGLLGVSPKTSVGAGSADFRLFAARLEACPLRLSLFPPLSLAPCGAVEVGLLFARGHDVAHPTDASGGWRSLDLGVRLRMRLSTIFFAEIDSYAVFPLTRRTFVFDAPRSTIYSVPALGGTVGAGVGFAFL